MSLFVVVDFVKEVFCDEEWKDYDADAINFACLGVGLCRSNLCLRWMVFIVTMRDFVSHMLLGLDSEWCARVVETYEELRYKQS